jgi:hypothetical protein
MRLVQMALSGARKRRYSDDRAWYATPMMVEYNP